MIETFETDIEKISDLLQLISDNNFDTEKGCQEFLASYSYLTYEEVKGTLIKVDTELLAYLMRRAENMNIEEMNGRSTGLAITSEQVKTTVTNYVYNSNFFSKKDIEEFEDICNGMAV